MKSFAAFLCRGLVLLAAMAPGLTSLSALADEPTTPQASTPVGNSTIDMAEFERQLTSTGVDGWIHGSVNELGLYVFTYRDPNDFFNNAQFPLLAADQSVQAQLQDLHRHDKVRIKGAFARNGAPIKHIYVSSIEVLERWDSGHPTDPYQYETQLPDDLQNKTEILAKVHAVAGDGQVLVIEYGDAIIPVFVEVPRDVAIAKDLFRNDKIRLKFVLRTFPDRPTHVSPNPDVTDAIAVVDRIADEHNQSADLEGSLVLYPKSPEIAFDVYALQYIDADGIARDYTLVNFDDNDVFTAIRTKCAAMWDAHAPTAVNGRNKLINRHVRVHARGIFNVVSPTQANPQILLNSPDDLSLTFVP